MRARAVRLGTRNQDYFALFCEVRGAQRLGPKRPKPESICLRGAGTFLASEALGFACDYINDDIVLQRTS